ncbi:MAG: cytochrome P450 [Paracoccaceae bacterium]
MQTVFQSLVEGEFVENPYPFYAHARAAGPVVFWHDMGMAAAFDHATVMALLKDRRLGRTPLKARPRPPHLEPFRALEDNSLLELEPPRHTRLRGLVLRAFTSRRVASLKPDIIEITEELLNALPLDTAFDLIPNYCQPLPVRIIARLLGVPESMAPELLAWSRDMVAMYQTGVTSQVEHAAGQAAGAFTDFMRGYIQERRTTPADDLITHLIAAEEDGDRLSTDEMIATCILLLNAGHEATVHSIGNAVRVLIEHGHRPSPLGADLLCEELLRFEAPLHVFTRFSYEDINLPGGNILKRGQEIALVLGSANRDPDVFPNADQFLPSRARNPQTSFGGGLHFCVGAPLARAELQIALPALFAKFADLQFDAPPKFANSYHFHKHDKLMMRT